MFTYYICKITLWTLQYRISVTVLCFCDIHTCRNGCVTWKRGKDTTFNNSEAVAQSSPNTALNFSNIYQNIQIDDSATVRGNDKTADVDNDVDIDEKIHNENPYGDVYKNEKTIPYVAVGNLGNEIIEKSKNENDGFKKEYALFFRHFYTERGIHVKLRNVRKTFQEIDLKQRSLTIIQESY